MAFSYTFNDSFFDQNDTFPLFVNPKTQPCEIKLLQPTTGLTLCSILIVIFLLAVPGNLLVGWVISTSKQAMTPSDTYLFHLTIADGLMALTLPFFALAQVQGWIFGDFMCKLLNLISEANFYTSIIFLACISIDRYLVIVHANKPLRSRHRKCSRFLCAAVWALGWALALPALFNDVIQIKGLGLLICTESFDIGRAFIWRLATRGFRHVFGFVVPLTVMIACYSITIRRLLDTCGFQKHRAMRVIIVVVIAFFLCWTPYHITMVVDTLIKADLMTYGCTLKSSVRLALDLTYGLALTHSCINPFLYAFVGEKFRKKMAHLLQRKFRRERMSGSKFSRSTSQSSDGAGTVL